MNICSADCGFDPHAMDKFEDVTVELINDPEGFDLAGHTNLHISLASEKGDITIEDFNNMQPGKEYVFVVANGANTQNQLIFPSRSTLYNGEITKANNMTIVYRFFTDGYSIYCNRAVYK